MATGPNLAHLNSAIDHSLQTGQIDDLIELQHWAHKITSILDFDVLIDQIVNHVSCAFGCVEANLYLHDEERAELELASVCGCTVNCKGHRLKVGKEGMAGHVALTGAMHYAPDVRIDPYYVPCEESTRSEVAIPLLFEGRILGVFSAAHTDLDAFPPSKLGLMQALSNHIAVAVHNCQRFQKEQQERQRMAREAQEARTIQQALLPKSSPYAPGFVISGLTLPAGEVGGDWYDFISFDDGCWGLVLADVSGKGTAAALLMSATRGMLRSLAVTCHSPSEVLSKLNRLMVKDFPSGRFVTLIYAVLNPSTRTLKFASAGHLPPLLVDSAGARFISSEKGMPLGLTKSDFSDTEVRLSQSSRLVFYSDGITEALGINGQEYGTDRLRAHMLKSDVSSDSILADVRAHANGAGLQDDATVIFLRG